MKDGRLKKDILFLAILFVITLLWFGIPARIIQGSYTQNYQTLAFELAGKDHEAPPQQWIEKWMWHKGSPYKYRILGKLPVWLIWKVTKGDNPGKTFYWIYLLWLFVFAYAAITAVYFYLKTLFTNIPKRASPFAQNIAFGGSILFYLIPAFLFAFKFPGHTKVIDILAYFLLTLGVYSIIRRRLSWMIMISSIGIFCHETLLIVPLIYFIVGKETFMKKCLYAGIPFIIWFVYRMLWWGMYNPLIFSKVSRFTPVNLLKCIGDSVLRPSYFPILPFSL